MSCWHYQRQASVSLFSIPCILWTTFTRHKALDNPSQTVTHLEQQTVRARNSQLWNCTSPTAQPVSTGQGSTSNRNTSKLLKLHSKIWEWASHHQARISVSIHVAKKKKGKTPYNYIFDCQMLSVLQISINSCPAETPVCSGLWLSCALKAAHGEGEGRHSQWEKYKCLSSSKALGDKFFRQGWILDITLWYHRDVHHQFLSLSVEGNVRPLQAALWPSL